MATATPASRSLLVGDPSAYTTAKLSPSGRPGTAIIPATTPESPTVTQTPALNVSFPGISDYAEYVALGVGAEPPDTQVAAGPSSLLEMVNVTGQIYSKTGVAVTGLFLLRTFFGIPSNLRPTDPRVLFDSSTNRFFATILGIDTVSYDSAVFLAVSSTADPMGAWLVYGILSNVGLICDQPKLGYSGDKFLVGCTDFNSANAVVGGVVIVSSKTQALAGTTMTTGQTAPNSSLFGLVPAQNYGPDSTGYVVFNRSHSGIAAAGIITVTGDPAAGISAVSVSAVSSIPIPLTTFPPPAPQNGSTTPIDTGDDRFMSVVATGGNLWTTATEACVPQGDSVVRSCLRLVEVSISGLTLIQSPTAGIPGSYLFHPTLGLDSSMNVFFVYSTSSPTRYASLEATTQLAGSPNTFGAGILVQPGISPYSGIRWGDYGAAANDPGDPTKVWIAGEYSSSAIAGIYNWGTEIGALTMVASAPPTVASVAPLSGPASGGTSVIITGTNFTAVSSVKFGAAAPPTYTIISSTQISTTSPPGTGAVDVTVTTSSGTSAVSSADLFSYLTPVTPPTVIGLNPTSGASAGGTLVIITGAAFSGATMVRFGTNQALSFTITSPTQITAASPPASGAVDVTVTTPIGTSAISPADLFTYLVSSPAPGVTALNPGSGAGLGGTQVSISGTALSGATAVKFGTTLATSFNIVGSTQITAVSPPGSGIVDLTVSTPNGTSAISVADQFTYVPDPGPPNSGRYHPVAPARILDTRFGIGAPVGPVGPQSTLTAQIAGQGGIPSTGVLAVVMNVTVTNTTAPSFLTIYPSGVSKPLASNLNWIPGQTVPNLVEVAVGSNGAVAAYNGAGSTDVIFDVAGYVSAPITNTGTDGLYKPVVPTRVLDTRTGNGGYSGPVGPGQTISIRVGGGAGTGIPATGVSAAVLNFTVTGPTAPSFLTVYPMGGIQPNASNVNFVTGQTVPNRVIVKVGINPQTSTSGWLSIYNAAGWVDVVADVGGWFTDGTDPSATGAAFVGMTPTRLSDTRNGSGPLGAGASRVLQVGGQAGVPSTATAVVLNVTVTGPTATSFLTVWPDGAAQPLASDLNYGASQTVPNLVVVKLGPNGAVDFYNLSGSTDVVVDIVGWYG